MHLKIMKVELSSKKRRGVYHAVFKWDFLVSGSEPKFSIRSFPLDVYAVTKTAKPLPSTCHDFLPFPSHPNEK